MVKIEIVWENILDYIFPIDVYFYSMKTTYLKVGFHLFLLLSLAY